MDGVTAGAYLRDCISAHPPRHTLAHTHVCDDIWGYKSPGPSKQCSSLAIQSEFKMMGHHLNATLPLSEIENQMILHVKPLININAMLVLGASCVSD